MSELERIGDFLSRYDKFKSNSELDDLDSFAEAFSRLRQEYEELQKRPAGEGPQQAP